MIKEYYGCIYKATNKINGKSYIGQTIRGLKMRKSIHLTAARKPNPKCIFHRAIKKYGEENFEWEIIQVCDNKEELSKAEIKHIKKMMTKVPYGYNATFGGEIGYSPKKIQKPKLAKESKYQKKPKEEWQHKKQAVYCVELKREFGSIQEAAEELNMCKSSIQQAAIGKINRTNGLQFRRIIDGEIQEMEKKERLYKVKSKITGLFKSKHGGFSHKGSTFTSIRRAQNSIKKDKENLEIIEYELVETGEKF